MTENPAIRAAFELWAKGRGMRLGLSRRGNYVWPATSFAWKVWQAALGAPATAGEATAAQGADWLPIETAPKDEGVWIAALGVHGDIPDTIRWIHGDWDDGWGTEIVRPTHWMPLPAAPSPAAPGNGEGKS